VTSRIVLRVRHLLVLTVLPFGIACGERGGTAPATVATAARYVGGQACVQCHQQEYAGWNSSQHAGAMKHAADSTVLANFDNATFNDGRVTTRFSRRDGRFIVNTEGPDGKLHDYEVKYTFGLFPLQQYLIDIDNGRIQSLTVAWDSRPKAEGGQHWFSLYPGEKILPGESIHWTGRDQNWNFMCAECHSTNVKKNFDPTQPRFTTSWSDISVNCEACHGAGSEHVAWAGKGGKRGQPGKMGLVVDFNERQGVTWPIDPATGIGVRSSPRRTDKEIETCGLCHARRAQLADGYVPGQNLGTTDQVALLDAGLYWPDGQMRDEVYNYGPFLQSRMYHQGVTCSDCHDPHTQQLRAPGAQVCLACHAKEKFEGPVHDKHPAGTKRVDCVSCHMPQSTFMVIDQRHDHSFRIPRPEQTVQFGVPNTCNQCHREQTPQWAAEQLVKWYGHAPEGYQRYAAALYASELRLPGSLGKLTGLAGDTLQPAIARATAVSRLAGYTAPSAVSAAEAVVADRDPLLRAAAVTALGSVDPASRMRLLAPRLSDTILAVRIDAARALAGLESQLPTESKPAFTKALQEYVDVQMFNADRPESWSNLGTLYAQRGDGARAAEAYNRAIALDSAFVPAWVNLADYLRATGNEVGAGAALRDGIRKSPDNASLHYALGLTLIRQRQLLAALAELKLAAALAPDDAHMGYVYGVALHDTGNAREGVKQLQAVLKAHPDDVEVLQALLAYSRETGDVAAMSTYGTRLQEINAKGP
jgi:tetratricopeptide (TPR) repeat protein